MLLLPSATYPTTVFVAILLPPLPTVIPATVRLSVPNVAAMPGTLSDVTDAFPSVISLDTVAEEAAALYPIIVLLEPVVRLLVPEKPAAFPSKVLLAPEVTALPALNPAAVLLLPVVLNKA